MIVLAMMPRPMPTPTGPHFFGPAFATPAVSARAATAAIAVLVSLFMVLIPSLEGFRWGRVARSDHLSRRPAGRFNDSCKNQFPRYFNGMAGGLGRWRTALPCRSLPPDRKISREHNVHVHVRPHSPAQPEPGGN